MQLARTGTPGWTTASARTSHATTWIDSIKSQYATYVPPEPPANADRSRATANPAYEPMVTAGGQSNAVAYDSSALYDNSDLDV